jgi:hypothetical protein
MKLDFLTKRIGGILKDVGCSMTLRKQVIEPYNPHDIKDPVFEDYACSGVITNPSRQRKGDGQGTEGTGAVQVLLGADQFPDSIEPAAGDALIIDGVTWTVVRNSPVKPANKHIMHKLVLKP